MSQIYIEYDFKVHPMQPGVEILIAELGAVGFESFVEDEEGVKAYIQMPDWNEQILERIHIMQSEEFTIRFSKKEIAQVNWNEAWEKNFSPIVVGDSCAVRAPFHEPFKVPYEIIIEPKMSFGTGHHETTFMMLEYILENDFKEKSVLDMGCGTAVLAILTAMRGATSIDAIDIDPWCVENSEENIRRNGCQQIAVSLGDAHLLPNLSAGQAGKKYHTVIANINRNILLQDLPIYAESLKSGGEVYLSGFYTEDLPLLKDACNNLDLSFVDNKERNNWVAAKFVHS